MSRFAPSLRTCRGAARLAARESRGSSEIVGRTELAGLPARLHDRIVNHLLRLAEQPRPPGSRKLQGTDAYRIRVGDYRVLYEVDDQRTRVVVYSIVHRREVCR
ncbi:MAG TPA: type II toxin-antitoxin system RelE/ParE family toxin [Bryobacteraceae bacterium]|nr:type II toxin-antitoxin system RelE/ParE family toxin [Bryobacteraceae bacterium]